MDLTRTHAIPRGLVIVNARDQGRQIPQHGTTKCEPGGGWGVAEDPVGAAARSAMNPQWSDPKQLNNGGRVTDLRR